MKELSKDETQAVIDSVLQAWSFIQSLTRTSPNPVEDAKDLFNDTVVALLQRRASCGTVPNAKYAKLTARSQFYSAKRRERDRRACEKSRTVTDEDATKRWNGQGMPKDRNSALDSVLAVSDNRALSCALDAISAADREVIDLYFSQRKKRREVAAALNLSTRGATSRKCRALKRLRHAANARNEFQTEVTR